MSWSIRNTDIPWVRNSRRCDAEQLALGGVEAGRRLVEQHQLGVGGERPGDADQLALAVAEVGRERVGEVVETEHRQRPVDLLVVGLLVVAGPHHVAEERVPPRSLGGRQQVVADRQVLEQLERLERAAQPEVGAAVGRLAGEVDAVERHRAAADVGEAGDGVDERRLAGTVRADQPDELARLDVEVDVLVGVQAAVA